MKHVNIEADPDAVPPYAVHTKDRICGFFGRHRYLSNFFAPANGVHYEGLSYPSVEHAYQAAKYPVNLMREQFTTVGAARAKRLGHSIENFDIGKWEKRRVGIMTELVLLKFTQNRYLGWWLLATGDAHLEERNSWHDTFWGTDEQGNGENQLGRILMLTRDALRVP
jgi:ribA/ribD-fused uncharacterized protein